MDRFVCLCVSTLLPRVARLPLSLSLAWFTNRFKRMILLKDTIECLPPAGLQSNAVIMVNMLTIISVIKMEMVNWVYERTNLWTKFFKLFNRSVARKFCVRNIIYSEFDKIFLEDLENWRIWISNFLNFYWMSKINFFNVLVHFQVLPTSLDNGKDSTTNWTTRQRVSLTLHRAIMPGMWRLSVIHPLRKRSLCLNTAIT